MSTHEEGERRVHLRKRSLELGRRRSATSRGVPRAGSPHAQQSSTGTRSLTFAEFDATVDRVAAALSDAGLTKGDRLALTVAQLLAISGSRVRHGQNRRHSRAGELHARAGGSRLIFSTTPVLSR